MKYNKTLINTATNPSLMRIQFFGGKTTNKAIGLVAQSIHWNRNIFESLFCSFNRIESQSEYLNITYFKNMIFECKKACQIYPVVSLLSLWARKPGYPQ